MKRKIILSLITISVLSFASCGNSTTEEPETTVPVETTAEATPEPTVTPEPTATPNVETGTVEESTDSTSSIDSTGVDSKIDEGDYIDPTPAQVTTSSDTAEVPKEHLQNQWRTDIRKWKMLIHLERLQNLSIETWY